MAGSSNSRLPWLVIRHVEHEHIGTLAVALQRAGLRYRYHDVFRDPEVPEELVGAGGLIVMGGPMGVYEADCYPFLRREQSLIRHAADSGLPVLGICLGAQLIAAALGARVFPGPAKEIGWYPVERTASDDAFVSGLPSSFMAFHWHGDTFDLPLGAQRLFRSQRYENQGFRWAGHVYAIQFHFEVTAGMIEEWLQDPGCVAELAALPDFCLDTLREQTRLFSAGLEQLSTEVFGRFLQRFAHS